MITVEGGFIVIQMITSANQITLALLPWVTAPTADLRVHRNANKRFKFGKSEEAAHAPGMCQSSMPVCNFRLICQPIEDTCLLSLIFDLYVQLTTCFFNPYTYTYSRNLIEWVHKNAYQQLKVGKSEELASSLPASANGQWCKETDGQQKWMIDNSFPHFIS